MAKAKYTYHENRKEWSTLVWDGTYTDMGEKHRIRIKSKKSSADLEKKVIAHNLSIQERLNTAPTSYTFGEYAQHWLKINKATKEANTIRMYEIVLKSSFNSINYLPLSQITHSHFQQCINEKLDHPRTCQQIYITFRQIIKQAVKDHYLQPHTLDEVITDISLPKYKKPVKRVLTTIEKEALELADLDPKKRAFVSLLYYCGLRKSEALALTPSDFDWKEKTVSINKAWIDAPAIKDYPKSDNGIRVIPIPKVAIKQIKPFAIKCKSEYLFHSQNTKLMTESGYKRMWESIIMSMNIALGYNPNAKINKGEKLITGLTAHIFRHNYCTELCYQVPKISTKMIAHLLGDNEKMVLEVYSHLIMEKEDTQKAINAMFS